jgi:hypothetical protein
VHGKGLFGHSIIQYALVQLELFRNIHFKMIFFADQVHGFKDQIINLTRAFVQSHPQLQPYVRSWPDYLAEQAKAKAEAAVAAAAPKPQFKSTVSPFFSGDVTGKARFSSSMADPANTEASKKRKLDSLATHASVNSQFVAPPNRLIPSPLNADSLEAFRLRK